MSVVAIPIPVPVLAVAYGFDAQHFADCSRDFVLEGLGQVAAPHSVGEILRALFNGGKQKQQHIVIAKASCQTPIYWNAKDGATFPTHALVFGSKKRGELCVRSFEHHVETVPMKTMSWTPSREELKKAGYLGSGLVAKLCSRVQELSEMDGATSGGATCHTYLCVECQHVCADQESFLSHLRKCGAHVKAESRDSDEVKGKDGRYKATKKDALDFRVTFNKDGTEEERAMFDAVVKCCVK